MTAKKDIYSHIKKASKKPRKLLASIEGPGGCGKSLTSLKLICALADNVVVIDGEEGKINAYADRFEFDVLELEREDEIWRPQNFNGFLKGLADKGYDGIIVDSFSQEWEATLDYVEGIAERARRSGKDPNTFGIWRLAKQYQNELSKTMQRLPAHQIYTLRSNTKNVMQKNAKGRAEVKCLGMKPRVGKEMQYEFHYRFEMDLDHKLTVGKFFGDPDNEMSGQEYEMPDEEFIKDIERKLQG